jgi:hemerythrin-like domain-containing protein
MYTRLEDNMTRKYYREILETAIEQAKVEKDASSDRVPMYAAVYNQLLDIKKNVVKENRVYTYEEASKRYSVGVVAAKNYEDAGDYQSYLFDIDWGIRYYPTMNEG